jgi:hypothetical protein
VSRPVLLNSCARAATAEEARFRIDYPLAPARATRVVALDAEAEQVVRAVSDNEWAHARFYVARNPGHDLVTMTGDVVPLAGELAGVDSLIMAATSAENAEAAATIGAACKVRGTMTAGLVLTPGRLTSDALLALRPYARILLVPADQDDLFELLRAIRA